MEVKIKQKKGLIQTFKWSAVIFASNTCISISKKHKLTVFGAQTKTFLQAINQLVHCFKTSIAKGISCLYSSEY